ncbi:uncharacterized protein [Pyxicephalus adspersus]|uniref:uncharacterized protein n=1 Tax=Pyxicephalus adspersus TaxID=30357 RepID=UPI003B59926C
MNMDELKQVINNFSFDRCKQGNQGFNRILIQLFGMLGHGKSSFINTCMYVWEDGEYLNWAKADEEYNGHFGGLTLERIPHKLTENIMLVDNRGLAVMDGYETGEIFAQLGNLLPLGKEVEWNHEFKLVEKTVQSEKLIKYSDFIVPVFVHSVKETFTAEKISDLKKVFHTARGLTGVYPIVVLTHRTFGNLTSVESTFKDMGIERIFSFENYTQEDHFKTRCRHEEVLKFLQEVIKDAQFRVEHQTRDPVIEMQERKQFVIKYVHEQEKRMTQIKLEKAKALEQAKKIKELKRQEEAIKQERERRRQAQEEEMRRTREHFEKQKLAEEIKRSEEIQSHAKPGRRKISDLFHIRRNNK